MTVMRTLRTLARSAATTLLAPTLALGSLSANSADEQLRFRVYLDDKPIGQHSFRIDTFGDSRLVASRASFDVDFLFINAYRYRHESRETWRDGCLDEIRATTDDNGKQLRVEGEATGKRFRIEGPDGRSQAGGCLMTFAYWNPDFLSQSRLLNPQTGELVDVSVRRLGPDRVPVEGRKVAATRYELKAEDLSIDLWYNDDLGWVGLESDTGKGARLIYRRI
jgi:hypothetical protein